MNVGAKIGDPDSPTATSSRQKARGSGSHVTARSVPTSRVRVNTPKHTTARMPGTIATVNTSRYTWPVEIR